MLMLFQLVRFFVMSFATPFFQRKVFILGGKLMQQMGDLITLSGETLSGESDEFF